MCWVQIIRLQLRCGTRVRVVRVVFLCPGMRVTGLLGLDWGLWVYRGIEDEPIRNPVVPTELEELPELRDGVPAHVGVLWGCRVRKEGRVEGTRATPLR